jgi:hypothetical protein
VDANEYLILFVVVVVVIILFNVGARIVEVGKRARQAEELEATLSRPADIVTAAVVQHLPAFLAKALPHVRNDYGTIGLDPDFDREIAYFLNQVVLGDEIYLRAARATMAIDPTAKERLLPPASQHLVELVKIIVAGTITEKAGKKQTAG